MEGEVVWSKFRSELRNLSPECRWSGISQSSISLGLVRIDH
jgi:hypothetical protein